MTYATVTLTGTYDVRPGVHATGTVTITPSSYPIVDATDKVILGGPFTVSLDAAGKFSVSLPATDDATLNPTGFGYTVVVSLSHLNTAITTSLSLPTTPATVDMSSVTSVNPATFTPGATYVPSNRTVNGHALSADVTVSKADVGLGSVDNTADSAKPVSTATQTALDGKATAAQGAKADAAIPSPSSPTDGQLLRWDGTLSQWVPTNPVGNSEVAVAVNSTGTVTSLTASGTIGTPVVIPSTTISVTNSNGRSVSLEYEGGFIQTSAGDGTVWLELMETTSGNVFKHASIVRLPNSTAAGVSNISIPLARFPIGAVTTTRTFRLQAVLYAIAANNPAGNIANSATLPTLLRAVAG